MLKEAFKSKDYEVTRVPLSQRKGFISLFVVMLGFALFSIGMRVGAELSSGLSFGSFIQAIAIGSLILSIYISLLAYVGSESGLSVDLLACYSFGKQGAYLPSAIITVTQIGWFGIGTAMFAYPAAEVLEIHPFFLILAIGLVATGSAWLGIGGLMVISAIAVPLISILGFVSLALVLDESEGILHLFGHDEMSMVTAVGLVVGAFIGLGTITPNFTRFAKSNMIAVTTTICAFFGGNCLMMIFGAIGGSFTKTEDLFFVMLTQGLAIPAIMLLAANIWTTNDKVLYSAGLSLSRLTKKPKRITALISGGIGTLAALFLGDHLELWLKILNALLAPIGIILILDYFIRRKAYQKMPPKNIRIFPIIGVVAGAVVTYVTTAGIPVLSGILAAAFCYLLGALFEAIRRQMQRGTRSD